MTLLAPAVLGGQSIDTATVPKELALALLSTTYGRSRDILVGKSASELATSLVPAGTPALGAVTGGTTIFVFAGSVAETMERVTAHVTANGWTEPKQPPLGSGSMGFAMVGGGFGGRGAFTAWCKDSSSAILMTMQRPGGGTYLSVSTAGKERSACDEAMFGRPGGRPSMNYGLLEPPPLVPPAGAVGGPSGSSSSDRDREVTSHYESKLNAEQMVEHFGAQMEKAGWTRSGRFGSKEVSMLVLQRKDAKGIPYRAVLVDVQDPPGKHSLQLTITKDVKDPFDP